MAYFYSSPEEEEEYVIVRKAKGSPKDVLKSLLKEEVLDAGLSKERAEEKVKDFNNITDKDLFEYDVERKNDVKEEVWEKYITEILGNASQQVENGNQEVNPEEVQENIQKMLKNKQNVKEATAR